MDIYSTLRVLAKSIKSQNLFLAAKEINNIRLFKNSFNFSKLQEIYLSYLYNYDSINHDIIIDKISKHIFDCDIYEDAYLIWKRKNGNKTKDNNQKDVNMVVGKEIKFPTKEN